MNISTEEQLNLGFDLGAVSTVKQRGNRMPKVIGDVVQNPADFNFYRTWSIASRNISREKIGKLVAFYIARGGTVQNFRYKDWADFHAVHDGVEESGYLGVGDGVETDFQLIKRYTVENSFDRLINKPVAGTVFVYFDGIQQASGWSISLSTGMISFISPPANGEVITADFEFDVKAKFITESFNTKFLAYQQRNISIHNLPALQLREV